MFSSKFYTFSSSVYIFDQFWSPMVGVQLHSFACGYSVHPAVCWKDLFFPHWMILAPLWKINWPVNSGCGSRSLSYSTGYKNYPINVLHYFVSCHCVVGFNIRKYDSSDFVLLYQYCLARMEVFIDVHYQAEEFPFLPIFPSIAGSFIMNRYWHLLKAFLHLLRWWVMLNFEW